MDKGDQDEDKKRTEVGIGEVVILTLNGKRLKEIDMDSIEWSLEPEKIATIEESDQEKNQATLTINKDLTQNTTLKIRVKTNLDEELPARPPSIFTILVPFDITAEHSGERDKKQDIRLQHLQNMKLPSSFSWTCGWYIRADGKDHCKISNDTYTQDFSFKYEDGIETDEKSPTRGLKNIKVTITKFGCTVTRSTAGDALHVNSTTSQ